MNFIISEAIAPPDKRTSLINTPVFNTGEALRIPRSVPKIPARIVVASEEKADMPEIVRLMPSFGLRPVRKAINFPSPLYLHFLVRYSHMLSDSPFFKNGSKYDNIYISADKLFFSRQPTENCNSCVSEILALTTKSAISVSVI